MRLVDERLSFKLDPLGEVRVRLGLAHSGEQLGVDRVEVGQRVRDGLPPYGQVRLGEQARDLLQALHPPGGVRGREVLRRALLRHGGYEIGVAGRGAAQDLPLAVACLGQSRQPIGNLP
ncbi:MAG TPA: hypothetical protein VH594_20225 [Trebonia sp.]|jgi:hypothetical protein